jgi:hypothetical protein
MPEKLRLLWCAKSISFSSLYHFRILVYCKLSLLMSRDFGNNRVLEATP